MGSSSQQFSLQASPSASPESSLAQQQPANPTATRPASASVDAGVSRISVLSPSTAERPRALTSNQSLTSPSASASSHGHRRSSPPSIVQRLSVSLHRSSVVGAVANSFGARLAGSFSTNASPASIAKQLSLHQRKASVSRASRASVMRADPTSQRVNSVMRAQGITSPSHIPAHLVSHPPTTHSRQPSADHSHLQLTAAAPAAVRLTAALEDGTALPQQPAAVEELSTAAHQREVSRSVVSRASNAPSVSSTVSSRQSEVEQVAQRLRTLDQELMHRKPSVILHPISKKLSQVQREQQQQRQVEVEDERMRGQMIDTPPTYTIALDAYQPTTTDNPSSPPPRHKSALPITLPRPTTLG